MRNQYYDLRAIIFESSDMRNQYYDLRKIIFESSDRRSFFVL